MKSASVILLTLLVSFTAMAEAPPSRVSAFLGSKAVSGSEWKPYEDQFEVGLAADINLGSLPVNLYIGTTASIDKHDSGDDEGKTTEQLLGISKHFSNILPFDSTTYVMGGIARIEGELTKSSVTEKDDAIGYFMGSGIVWNFTQHFDIGFEFRYSHAEITLGNEKVNAGGSHFGITTGFNW